MYCTNCGKEIDDKAVLCVHCGVPVKKTMPVNTTPKVPCYEKESYIMNASAGSLMMWLLFQIVIVFVVIFVSAIAFAPSILYVEDFTTTYAYTLMENLSTLAATIGASLFSVMMFKSMLKIKLPTMKKLQMSIPRILYYTAIAMGVSALASWGVNLLDYLLSFLNIQMSTPDFSMKYDLINNLLLIATTCIAAPIFEELLFRGLILTSLKRFGNMFAIIITSLLFALTHGNIPQAVPVFFMSLVLCYVALRSKSLLPTMIMHYINNMIAMVFTFMQGYDFTWIISIALDVILILFAAVVLFNKRKQIKKYIQKHKGTPLLSYYKHWAPIVYTLLSLVMIAFSFVTIYAI